MVSTCIAISYHHCNMLLNFHIREENFWHKDPRGPPSTSSSFNTLFFFGHQIKGSSSFDTTFEGKHTPLHYAQRWENKSISTSTIIITSFFDKLANPPSWPPSPLSLRVMTISIGWIVFLISWIFIFINLRS